MNTKNLIAGICFILFGIICLYTMISNGFKAYYLTGCILFPVVGIAFLRRVKIR